MKIDSTPYLAGSTPTHRHGTGAVRKRVGNAPDFTFVFPGPAVDAGESGLLGGVGERVMRDLYGKHSVWSDSTARSEVKIDSHQPQAQGVYPARNIDASEQAEVDGKQSYKQRHRAKSYQRLSTILRHPDRLTSQDAAANTLSARAVGESNDINRSLPSKGSHESISLNGVSR